MVTIAQNQRKPSRYSARNQKVKLFEVNIEVNKKSVNFEIDTGCSVSIMNESKFKEKWDAKQCPQIKQTKLILKSYSGEKNSVVGVAEVEVKHARQVKRVPLVVVKGSGASLLGRGWLEAIKLKWAGNEEVLKKELGRLKGMEAAIRVSAEAHPKFYHLHSVPYAIRAQVDAELDRMLKEEQNAYHPSSTLSGQHP